MYITFKQCRIYPVVILLTSLMSSVYTPVYANIEPYEQTFVVTAYYSPVPDQCCYYRGSYEDEIAFNGGGVRAADGTPVYSGMIAAPASYAFGTVIDLPGLGAGTVHDRGGRIIEWGDDIHRIDLWMGVGEEGLSRALAWGTRTVHGVVYPSGTSHVPEESIDITALDAQRSSIWRLTALDPMTLLTHARYGEETYAVRTLQETLQRAGYFHDAVTGRFGPVTQKALAECMSDIGLAGDARGVTENIAAHLIAVSQIQEKNLPDLHVGLSRGSRGARVRDAQKLLRYIGYYRGRTDGLFDIDLRDAVLALQKAEGLIASEDETGAGRIGPQTRDAILRRWKAKVVQAKATNIVLKNEVRLSVKKSLIPSKVLAKGDAGSDVRRLQRALRDLGYLPSSDMTGTFADRTEKALLRYQKDREIITEGITKGAGVFGPATRSSLMNDLAAFEWEKMRRG